jgi:alkylmercury lyase
MRSDVHTAEALEIRPGVFRPDWSAAKSPAAREALGIRTATGRSPIDKLLIALTPDEDRVWRAVLELYGTLGRPPRTWRIVGMREPQANFYAVAQNFNGY